MILFTLFALGLPGLLFVAYNYFKKLRLVHANVPSLKRNLLFGNIFELGKYMKPGRHPDYGLEQIYKELGQPEMFLLDVQPLHRVLVVTDPAIAEQMTRPSPGHPYSIPKSWTLKDVEPLVGHQSILISAGEEWKATRKSFQPGFQSKHIQSLIPLIINETQIFASKLQEKADSNEPFQLGKMILSLTVDVIVSVVLGHSFHAQDTPDGQGVRGPDGVLTAFAKVQENFTDRGNLTLYVFNPLRLWRLAHYERILSEQMQKMIKEAVRDSDADPSSRAVVHLALKDRPLTPQTLSEAADQLRTFIFAGFDTTSTLLQWAFYYLSLPSNAVILDKLRTEHDELLGPVGDIPTIEAYLRTDPTMPYTTAVLKECLRLEPPASSARWVPPVPIGEPFNITTADGTSHEINGSPVYIIHKIIHNTTKIWGPDARVFRPDRWLDKDYVAALPAGAFRPFERGPRACIGQELAMIEAKIVLALITRLFVFTKFTPRGEECELGDVWSAYNITSSPNDGMRMTVKKR